MATVLYEKIVVQSLKYLCDLGHYMYYETSQPVRPSQYGDLFSPRMHLYGKQCVRFYYHASGNDTRRLEVYLREPAQYTTYPKFTLLKMIEGKQKNSWMPVNADIDISGDFNVSIHIQDHYQI